MFESNSSDVLSVMFNYWLRVVSFAASNEMILEHLKTLDYPYAVHKSSIMNPNNSSSWPYNLAILAFLKQLYDLAHYSSDEVDDSDFCINDQLNSGLYY